MSTYLYILDAGDHWALATRTPEVEAMLEEVDVLWDKQVDPVTINQVEL
jgi:hypothetical protein